MRVSDFRSILKSASICFVSTELVPGDGPRDLKVTKTSLREAVKGQPGDSFVNAVFREDDGALVILTASAPVESDESDADYDETDAILAVGETVEAESDEDSDDEMETPEVF